MSKTSALMDNAFRRLAERPGFIERPDQRQLAFLISDLIEESARGVFEAPTGLGKSLAALIPAISHAIASKKRTVIATYTNVLAEQYWRQDLPFALELFEDAGTTLPKAALMMGRSKYACMLAVQESIPEIARTVRESMSLGIESEFRKVVGGSARSLGALWSKVQTPPVCPGKLCPAYDECFYYNARKAAESAEIVITNHSVVVQDALMARSSDDEAGMLGEYDFLILDEAHDFPQAATNGLEFELSSPRLAALVSVAARLDRALSPIANAAGEGREWSKFMQGFSDRITECEFSLKEFGRSVGGPGIMVASPQEVMDHPQVKSMTAADDSLEARRLTVALSEACEDFVSGVEDRMDRWRDARPEGDRVATESVRNYFVYIREYGRGCHTLFAPEGVAVSYVGLRGSEAMLREDVIDLAEPLRELIWQRSPYACISATLALDGDFEHFARVTGVEPDFSEILPSPFDLPSQTAVYLPSAGVIPDPSVARREMSEPHYYSCLAGEISRIVRAMGGRTLALFHSRREMEEVAQRMDLPSKLPLIVQSKFGVGGLGERFRENPACTMFGLRSFWTGFDAPGDTLSCVVLVRVPFEVPVDPPQIARMAYFQTQGRDAFREHALPNAKMLIRQGAGRLIRQAQDRGVIAMLDPRIRSKPYGEEILMNFDPHVRVFNDFLDAMAHVGLS